MTDNWTCGENWVRRELDGLLLQQITSGDWIVNPGDGRRVIVLCPCCEKPMRTPTAAMGVADHVYPPQPP